MKLTIVFNNEAREGFRQGWGFACLAEDGSKKVLFDTGCDGRDLLYNLEKLGIDPAKIDAVVLSHQHRDHTGGLFELLKHNDNAEVFVLDSFSEHFKSEVRRKAGKMTEVKEEAKIADRIYTTGLVPGNPDEQALVIETGKGIVLIVGCSHPGVDKIMERAKRRGESSSRIHAIIGGFHGFSDIEALAGIDIIGACHCTQHIREIKERFPKQFREIKAGDVIKI